MTLRSLRLWLFVETCMVAAVAACVLVFSASAAAQATPTATKTEDLSIFVGYVTAQPDYGPFRNSGGTLGVDFTRYFHFPVAPSLELRANYANGVMKILDMQKNLRQYAGPGHWNDPDMLEVGNGMTVNERSYLAGLRVQADIRQRVHPYVDFLVGPGNIHFNFPNNGYTGDNSIVYSYGGGVDFDLVNHFAAKVDWQGQHWNTGSNSTLTPSLLLFGFSYRLPFEPHVRQGAISH